MTIWIQISGDALVTKLCLAVCDPMDCRLPGSSVHEIFPGKNIGVDCHFFLQGIFPTQGLNQDLLHCRQILYWLSHQGSQRYKLNPHNVLETWDGLFSLLYHLGIHSWSIAYSRSPGSKGTLGSKGLKRALCSVNTQEAAGGRTWSWLWQAGHPSRGSQTLRTQQRKSHRPPGCVQKFETFFLSTENLHPLHSKLWKGCFGVWGVQQLNPAVLNRKRYSLGMLAASPFQDPSPSVTCGQDSKAPLGSCLFSLWIHKGPTWDAIWLLLLFQSLSTRLKSCLTLWPIDSCTVRLPCPSLALRVCSNSCPFSQ